MQMTTGRSTLTMTLALALTAGACQGRTGSAGGTESAARDTTATATDTTATRAPAVKGPGDETILGMLDAANRSDSTAGVLASKKATDPEVKAFAATMMKDHHELRVKGEELAKKLGITPKPPEKDPVAGYVNAELNALLKAKKGEFDQLYIDNEVTVHQAVLDAANMARVSASSPELKELIQNTIPIIQGHLAQAQAIQKRFGSTT
jgi:putative membrane protein